MDNSLHPVATWAAEALLWLWCAAAGNVYRDASNCCRLLEHSFGRRNRQNGARVKSEGDIECNWRWMA